MISRTTSVLGSLARQQCKSIAHQSISQSNARFSRNFSSEVSRRHIIAALVVNQPGVLAEIANLFAARGYNIDSLVVGRTEVEELSRMTVVVNGTDRSVANMKQQMEDVVPVAVVNILSSGIDSASNYVERDLMLAKVSTETTSSRNEVIELASLFGAKVIDVRPHQIMVELAGKPSRIAAFLDMLKPLGITEIHRSGVIAMARVKNVHEELGDFTFEGATQSIMHDADEVDSTNLPPG